MYNSRKYPKLLQFWLPLCLFTIMYKTVLFAIPSEDLMINLQHQLVPFTTQLNCLLFAIYIHSSKSPFLGAICGSGYEVD